MASYRSAYTGTQIDNAVNKVTNNVYTKEEVNNLVSTIPIFSIEVVNTLPVSDISTTTIYLVSSNSETSDIYKEYIYVNNNWELLGIQKGDLSDYYTKTETNTLLNAKANSNDLSTVATSGSYNDLLNTPTNLTDFDGTLPILQGGTGATTSTNARTNLEVMKITTLYNNASGTNGTITLSSSVSNFEYIDIFYKADSLYFASQRLFSPNNKSVHLFLQCAHSTYYFHLTYTSLIKFSDDTVTWISSADSSLNINSAGDITLDFLRGIYIYKIIGYSY